MQATWLSWPSSRTAATRASSSTGLPASTSCSIEVRNAPSLRVTAWRSSGVCAIGMPMCSPMALASSMMRETKSRTSGSSKITSVVAPVKALMGLMVMLPQSLYQTSFWIWGETVALKPACTNKAASACTRGESTPLGSPTISPLPKWCRITPGTSTEQLACTTPPRMCAAGMCCAITPPASTESRWVPDSAPPKPCKNHHGTPFMAVSTTVLGPMSGPMRRATSAMAGAFTATITRSCTPRSAGFSRATNEVRISWSPCSSTKPFCCRASSVAPRATALRLQPCCARCAPIQPPMAPVP
jgi:hypothetical protein